MKNDLLIVGISGKKGAGKDTVADLLCHGWGFEKMPFAKPLKDACEVLFEFNYEQLYGKDKEKTDDFWKMTPRYVLQQVGTELFRNHFGGDFWIKAWERQVFKIYDAVSSPKKTVKIVVPDVRFTEEAAHIQTLGGVLIRVERAGLPKDEHVSETSLDLFKGWDHIIVNNDKLETLEKNVNIITSKIFGEFLDRT